MSDFLNVNNQQALSNILTMSRNLLSALPRHAIILDLWLVRTTKIRDRFLTWLHHVLKEFLLQLNSLAPGDPSVILYPDTRTNDASSVGVIGGITHLWTFNAEVPSGAASFSCHIIVKPRTQEAKNFETEAEAGSTISGRF